MPGKNRNGNSRLYADIMAEITLNCGFGRAAFLAVRVFKLRRILEIGSYDGDGSTQVLISAMKPLRPKRLVCLEMRPER